jgi:DNA-binding NarL/FixJ family response regulator
VPAPPDGTGLGELTRREVEILHLIATGLNTKDAAERLHVSPATIRNHVQNILGKLGAHSRLEAVAYATRNRLI